MKGNLFIYKAPIAQVVLSMRSGIDHTILPANYTMPALERLPDGATPD